MVDAKNHNGPLLVVKKQVLVVKMKVVGANILGGGEKTAIQYPIPQTGLGRADPGSGRVGPSQTPWPLTL